MPALISEDGRWWWDGTQWRSRLVDGPLDLFWFTTTPDWMSRILLIGLIGLIPIVGTINTLGWVLVTVDHIRQQWKELPPADFRYLSRGVAPFLVTLLYGIAFLLVFSVPVVAGLALIFTKPPHYVIAAFVLLVAFLLVIAWWLISLYFFAAVLIGSDRLGFERAIDPRVLIRLARQNNDVSIRVGLTYGLANLVLSAAAGAIGVVVPFGGIVVALAVPAVYSTVVPRLATFKVDG